MSLYAGVMLAAVVVEMLAWKATRMRLISFWPCGCLVSVNVDKLRQTTFQVGQLYGSAPDGLGIGSRSSVPWR